MTEEITNESNRYAKQVMGDEMSANGKGVEGFLGISHPRDHEPCTFHSWTTTGDEIDCFITP